MVIAKRKVHGKKPTVQLTNDTLKNMDYYWTSGPESNNQDVGVPRAIFVPHSNSLPFEERHVTLEQPVKVKWSILSTNIMLTGLMTCYLILGVISILLLILFGCSLLIRFLRAIIQVVVSDL